MCEKMTCMVSRDQRVGFGQMDCGEPLIHLKSLQIEVILGIWYAGRLQIEARIDRALFGSSASGAS